MGACRLATLALLGSLAGDAAAAPLFVDYLHVEANEGSASGGHTALRLGDVTFHYQFDAPGVLRLDAEPAAQFEARYRLLENRTIHVLRVPVTEDTFALLRDELDRQRLAQERQRACLTGLRTEVRLLEAIATARGDRPVGMPVPGAGFFAPADPAAAEEPALVALRSRVARERGAAFVADLETRLQARLRALPPPLEASPPADESVPVAPCYGGAARWVDDAAALLAVVALREARPLDPAGVRAPADPVYALDAAERARVAEIARGLEDRLIALLGASHPGRGFALAVGMARLAALERTIRTGRWHLLDAYPPDAAALAPIRLAHRRRAMKALAAIAGREFAQARRELTAAPAALDGVETAGNRLAELTAALEGGHALRIHAGPLLPVRAAMISEPAGEADDVVVAGALAAARAGERAYADAYARLHAYNLITRNCVTELFRTIEAAVQRATPRGASLEAELARRLGGRVRPLASLAFIPFVSADAVADHWSVTDVVELPSYRREQVAHLAAGGSPWWVHLREGNTLTSTLYRPNPDDSLFLFFTDDVVAPRPLLGAVNLAVGIGAGLGGLVTLPVDRGETLRAGIRGALFSLPELAFVSIRKGSFMHLPPG